MEGNILYNLKDKAEVLNSSISSLQNRIVSLRFANCALKIILIFRQSNVSIIQNNFCIEEQNETDNNVKIDINEITVIAKDNFADYIELMIKLKDNTEIFMHTL